MIRAYAIGLAAATQALTEGIGAATFGSGELRGDLAKGAGWVINLAIAEWIIRRPTDRRRSRRPASPYPAAAQALLVTVGTSLIDLDAVRHWAWLVWTVTAPGSFDGAAVDPTSPSRPGFRPPRC